MLYGYLISSAVFSIASALIAYSKGRNSLGWLIAGLAIGPFALIVALLPAEPREGRFVRCQSCAEVIAAEATLCRFCGERNREQLDATS